MPLRLLVLLSAIALSGCTTVSVPSVATSTVPDFRDLQKGEACGFYVLFFGPFGSSSLPKAVWNGEIQKVFSIEKEFRNYLLFSRDCTIVYGTAKGKGKDREKEIKPEPNTN